MECLQTKNKNVCNCGHRTPHIQDRCRFEINSGEEGERGIIIKRRENRRPEEMFKSCLFYSLMISQELKDTDMSFPSGD